MNSPHPPKIVVIGAGSASFGLSVLGKMLLEPGLEGSHLCLVDTNAGGLEHITRLAHRLNREWNSGFTIEGTTDRRIALPGADYVILSVAIDREKCWRKDYAIGQKHGINHYAENGGPGAFAHTARNLAIVMGILRDIEALAPEAWLLNFTNPVPRICIAAARYTKVRTIGICHQIGFGYMMLGNILQKEFGIEAPPKYRFRWDDPKRGETERFLSDSAWERADILAAGLNHFTWMLQIRDRKTGADLYPLLWERLKTFDPGFEPLTQEVARLFGVFPVPGDCHMAEYLPYSHNPTRGVWERYDIQMYDFDRTGKSRDEMWERVEAMGCGKMAIDSLREAHTERAEKVISAMVTNRHDYEEALNLPNEGYIPNLPEGVIVEVPAIVSAHGARGLGVGPLPEPIAELCRRQITVAELAVKAGVEGDQEAALQCLALDPMVDDPQTARGLLADFLSEFKEYLPQFGEGGC